MSESFVINLCIFLFAGAIVAVGGTKLSKIADRLADVTGLGEAVIGAVILGGSTSLSGIVTSVTAAAEGHPQMAVSNALGGIAAQKAFLAVADIAYRQANLEHAAASLATLVQGVLLSALLTIPLVAISAPNVEFLGLHPASFILPLGYLFGLRLTSQVRNSPMWKPQEIEDTSTDKKDADHKKLTNEKQLWLSFAFLAILIGGAGYLLGTSGVKISEQTGISETVVGGLFTAISTSLPELVTSIAAVQQGALTLAVSGIIGGNTFDVLMLSLSDVAYRQGSIYNAITSHETFVISLTILMTAILLLGLLRREKSGIGNIGFESFSILVLYLGGFAILMGWK